MRSNCRKWKKLGQVVATAWLVVLGTKLGWAQTLGSPQPAAVDLVDELRRACPHLAAHDSLDLQRGRKSVLLVPVMGYSQQTSGIVELAASVAFARPEANLSTFVATAAYSFREQRILTATSALWTLGNRWNLLGDWRLMHYPQSTYGLGMYTTTERVVTMDYEYLRFYQSALRHLGQGAWYAGLGYQLDDHWSIVSRNSRREVGRISRYRDGVAGRSISSGPVMNVLFDSRTNALSPQRGGYFNTQFRPNLTLLGSDTNYQSLLLEGRIYLHPFPKSHNILALWSYNALTLHGNPPFLDLPSTGWDTYSNIGRGFIQGRFRGKNLLYGEAEYRFAITRNRLLGGVVFANAESVTEQASGRFEKMVPAAGAGLRVNLNKVSHLNLAIDYGFGADGSRGLALNLGEVF